MSITGVRWPTQARSRPLKLLQCSSYNGVHCHLFFEIVLDNDLFLHKRYYYYNCRRRRHRYQQQEQQVQRVTRILPGGPKIELF